MQFCAEKTLFFKCTLPDHGSVLQRKGKTFSEKSFPLSLSVQLAFSAAVTEYDGSYLQTKQVATRVLFCSKQDADRTAAQTGYQGPVPGFHTLQKSQLRYFFSGSNSFRRGRELLASSIMMISAIRPRLLTLKISIITL